MVPESLGPYRILGKLGEGGMGQVYRATDTNLKRQVAIKVLPASVAGDADRLARFQREAEVLAALNHPNIAQIYGLEKSDGVTALVMELVEGEDLSRRIATGPIPLDEALPIARQIADALEAAHEQGIIHRDLKPANIKGRPDGTVKVLDFGLAKAMEPAAGSSPSLSMSPTITTPAMTQAGMILGTAAYMSPEQARGKTVDKRADIWAFGALVFEMLTGKRAFPGEDITDTLAAVVRAEPNWTLLPREISPTLLAFLRRCLQKDPKQRVGDIRDVRLALEGAFETLLPPTGAAPRRRWDRAGWIAAAVASMAAIGFAMAARRTALAETDAPAIHFTQALPTLPRAANAIAQSAPDQTLSPDGRYLAFAAPRVRGGSVVLWVRAFDAADASLVEGTEGAGYPFWSPDSRSVGFFAGGKLKVVSSDGSRLREVCDAPGGLGGTWNAEDVILFASAEPGAKPGILRVSANGGQPTVVTTPNAEQHERWHSVPSFLPGGHRFLYWSRTEQGGALMAASLDGGPAVRLVASTSKGQYSSGYLLFLDGSTLTAQPFDPATLRLTTPAVALVLNVLRNQDSGRAAFSSSPTGMLTYRTATTEVLQMSWLDRFGKRGGTIGDPGPWVQMALAPNDRQLAVQRDATAASDIWLFDLVRAVSSKFTVGGGNNGPVWSPTGSELAFRNNRRVLNEVFRKPLSGGDAVAWKGIPAHQLEDWSLDGRYVLGQGAGADLAVLPLTGDGTPFVAVPSTPGVAIDEAQMSPDGRWISYFSTVSGSGEIYLQPFPGPGERVTVSSGGGVQAKWRADSKELFYLSPDGTMMSVDVRPGATPDIGTPKPLFRTRLTPSSVWDQYTVTSDGQRFIVMEPATDAPPESLAIIANWTTLLSK